MCDGRICNNIKQELFTVPKDSARITHPPGKLVMWWWASRTLLRCLNLIINNFRTVYPRMWHNESETRSNVEQSFSDSLQISFGPVGVRDFSVIPADVRRFKYPLLNPKVQFRVTKARRCSWSWTRRIRSSSTPQSHPCLDTTKAPFVEDITTTMLNTITTIPTLSMCPIHQIFHNSVTFIMYNELWDKPQTLYRQNVSSLSLFASFYVQVFLFDSLLSKAHNPCSPSQGERSISLGINEWLAR